MKTKPAYVIIYARVSEDRRVGEAESPKQQLDDLRRLAQTRGWKILLIVLEDEPISASAYTKKKRKGYTELLAAMQTLPQKIRAKEPDADIYVAAWEGSRVTRRGVEREMFLDLCVDQRIFLNYNQTDYDPRNPDQRLALTIMGGSDTHSSAMTSARVTRDVRARVVANRPHGKMPRGYVLKFNENGSKRWVLDGTRSKAIRKAITNILNNKSGPTGDSVRAAHQLFEKTTGETIRLSGFKRTLVNPTFAGIRMHNGVRTGTGNWPALITEDEHRRLLAILNKPNRITPSRGPAPRYWGNGIIKCGRCKKGRMTYGKDGRQKERGVRVYVCGGCRGLSRMAEPVDMMIEKAIIGLLTDPGVIAKANEPVDDTGTADLEELHELRTRLDAFADDAADGKVSKAALVRIEARLTPRIEMLEQSLKRVAGDPFLMQHAGPGAASEWPDWSIEIQRALIRRYLDITLLPVGKGFQTFNPKAVVIEWLV